MLAHSDLIHRRCPHRLFPLSLSRSSLLQAVQGLEVWQRLQQLVLVRRGLRLLAFFSKRWQVIQVLLEPIPRLPCAACQFLKRAGYGKL